MLITDPMVICYIPGSGGVKLSQYLSFVKNTFSPMQNSHPDSSSKTPKEYTNAPNPCLFPCLSPNNNIVTGGGLPVPYHESPYPFVMSHSMSGHITKIQFPERKIIRIKSDFLKSLRRWWVVFAKDNQKIPFPVVAQYSDVVEKLNLKQQSIAGHILMHVNYYYHNYDDQADIVFDIEHGDHFFCKFMKQDLSQTNDEFDEVVAYLESVPRISDMIGKIRMSNT
jgi:hypothetical protein